MSIRRADSGAQPTTMPLARRDNAAFLDVAIAWCQPPVGLVGVPGDAAPPAWTVFAADGTVQAELTRAPAPKTTLAAVTDPFACGPTTSPARISATRVALATASPVNATDAFTAYACSPAEPVGYGLSTDATGGLWAAPTSTVSPAGCAAATSATFGPLLAGPVQLQQAPTPTSNLTLPNLGNVSWPNAGVAALCGPYVASALMNANYSAPLQSLEAAVQGKVQNAVFGALGPVGGSVVLVAVGGIVTGIVTGLTAWVNRRQKAAAEANKPPGGDVAADPQAIALAPQRYNPLAAADKLATPLTMPKTYDELVGAGGDPFALAPTLSYGASSPPATPEVAPAPTTPVPAPAVPAPSTTIAASTPAAAAAKPPASTAVPSPAPPLPPSQTSPAGSKAPASNLAVPTGAVGSFSRTGVRTASTGAGGAPALANRRETFAGLATTPALPPAPTPSASATAGAGRGARPSALTSGQSTAFSAASGNLRTLTPRAAAAPSTPLATPGDDRQALLSRFYR